MFSVSPAMCVYALIARTLALFAFLLQPQNTLTPDLPARGVSLMPLALSLKFTKTEYLLGENPPFTLTIENPGPELVEIPTTDLGSGMPAIRIVDLSTGADRIVRPEKVLPFSMETITLAVGQKKSVFYLLKDFAPLASPGRFMISAIYEWDKGLQKAESPAVQITIGQTAVHNLSIDNPTAPYAMAAFINSAAEKPDLIVGDVVLLPGGGFSFVRNVGKATMGVKPILGVHANKTPGNGRYLAFTHDSKLSFLHIDTTKGATVLGSIPLKPRSELIAPVFCGPNTEPGARGGGEALILTPDALGSFALKVVYIAPGNPPTASDGPSIAVPGRTPAWIANFFRADKAKVVAFIRSVPGKATLHLGQWPREGKVNEPPTLALTWDGDFVAAGASIGADDIIRGCALVWMGPPGERSLEAMSFTIDEKLKAETEPLGALPWEIVTPIDTAIVRVRIKGKPAILLRSGKGDWTVFDGTGKQAPVPVPYTSTKLPIDLAFFGDNEAVLVLAEMTGSLAVKRLDGSDLPPENK